MQSASAPAVKSPLHLLSLDEVEDKLVHLMEVCGTVCSAMSEVHPDNVTDVSASVRDFHTTLRLIYVSLLAHIRAHAGEMHSASGVSGAGPLAASSAAVSREYRRNVYLDTQQINVMMDSLQTVQSRIQEAQKQKDMIEAQSKAQAQQ